MTATWQDLPALALVGTYPPRRCGIATFTRDLRDALVDLTPPGARTPLVVAVDRGRRDPPRYPPEVTFRLKRSDAEAYRVVAAQLAVAGTEVVSLQHEYGIFGGPSGRHILELAAALRVPLVTTLHTVRAHPTPLQRAILIELVRRSARVVVMSERARHLLSTEYEAPSDKLQVIPHGVPQIEIVDPAEARARLGLPEGPLILSFGLLGPAKRLELVIDALARIRDRVPQTRFAIVGATHPEVRLRNGERYRAALAARAQALGLERHLLFVDRYVDDDELVAWLQAADLFVTPYGNAEQAASGTLAYAVAAGRACISTPYEYARELLADGRGVLVPFDDVEALADRLLALLTDPVERQKIGNRARALAADMSWDAVGDGYRAIFSQVAGEARHALRPVQMIGPEAAVSDGRVTAKTLPARVLPRIERHHLSRLGTGRGIWQHAIGETADPRHGTCTDDVARAVVVDLLHAEQAPGPAVTASIHRSLRFLDDAYDPAAGRFRNLRSADGVWLERIGSEDCHGRALQALGEFLARSDDYVARRLAWRLFNTALPAALAFAHLRPRSYAILGCAAALRSAESPALRQSLASLTTTLAASIPPATADWPWPEATVTYDNGTLPQALISAGDLLNQDRWVELGARLLDWLLAAQTAADGHLIPIGNRGWWPRGGRPASFDQQPIEATSLLEAARAALIVTGDARWLDDMERAYAWFLGENHLGLALAVPQTGACHDGLGPYGVNANCGAESTLAWLLAVERIREVRQAPASLRGLQAAVKVAR